MNILLEAILVSGVVNVEGISIEEEEDIMREVAIILTPLAIENKIRPASREDISSPL